MSLGTSSFYLKNTFYTQDAVLKSLYFSSEITTWDRGVPSHSSSSRLRIDEGAAAELLPHHVGWNYFR